MPNPTVHILYHNMSFHLPVGDENYPPNRLDSTPGDNCCEYAARTCYASLHKPKARPSVEYFENVLKYKHHSIVAHVVETFQLTQFGEDMDLEVPLTILHNRPGVWVTQVGRNSLRFAISLRAIIEWFEHGPKLDKNALAAEEPNFSFRLYRAMRQRLTPLYPLSLSTAPVSHNGSEFNSLVIRVDRVTPELPGEQWVSLYIDGVSRDLLQELARHHYQCNLSVRSTRYVDESECQFITHPALEDYKPLTTEVRLLSHETYRRVFETLTSQGVDEKTARGAARSCLLGCTETKLVWSLSKFQAQHVLSLRASESTGAVDPEIRRLAVLMKEKLITIWPDL